MIKYISIHYAAYIEYDTSVAWRKGDRFYHSDAFEKAQKPSIMIVASTLLGK